VIAPTIAQIAGKLTRAQRWALDQVCRSNGGGVEVITGREDHNYGVPTVNPWKKLWELDLIQGKAGHAYRVVHTRLGWQVRNYLTENADG
jgi:hypothetical protein